MVVILSQKIIFSQKLDIPLIGASHDYCRSKAQNISMIQERIRRFRPMAFFGEFVSPEDEKNLMDYWCKAENLKRDDTSNSLVDQEK
jgi:hypothetical protein